MPTPNRAGAKWPTVVGFVSLALVLVCGGCAGEKTIPYEVLEKSDVQKRGRFNMSILVSETASKEEVMALARSLQKKFAGEFALIEIYDSRETFRRIMDETYPAEEIGRHLLVAILDGDPKGPDWMGTLRDH